MIARTKPPNRRRKGGARRGPPRSPTYKKWISRIPCCMCTGYGSILSMLRLADFSDVLRSDPAHTGKDGGASMKSSDFSCIPLCRLHHDMFDGKSKCPSGDVGREAFIRYYGLPVDDIVVELNLEWQRITGKVAA